MGKFSKRTKQFNIVCRTVPVELPELQFPDQEGVPTLQVLSAGPANKAYFNEVLRIGGNELRRKGKKDVTVAEINSDRLKNAKLFAKHVVTGWSDLLDDEGEPVEFDEANCLELMLDLAENAPILFDRIRDVANDDEEFFETPAPDGDELAGK